VLIAGDDRAGQRAIERRIDRNGGHAFEEFAHRGDPGGDPSRRDSPDIAGVGCDDEIAAERAEAILEQPPAGQAWLAWQGDPGNLRGEPIGRDPRDLARDASPRKSLADGEPAGPLSAVDDPARPALGLAAPLARNGVTRRIAVSLSRG